MTQTVWFTKSDERARDVLRARCRNIPALAKFAPLLREAELAEILQTLPETDKSFYQHAGEQAYSADRSSVLLFSETSGTSGSGPLLTPRGRDDLHWNTRNQAHAYSQWLEPHHDRIMLLNPSVMSPFIEGSARALFDLGVAQMRAFPIPRICDWARMGRLINDYELTAIMSTPTLIFKLMCELDNLGIEVPSLRQFILTGEQLSRQCLNALDQVLGIPGASKVLVYGSSEAATVMHGVADGGYRGYLSDFLFEIKPVDFKWKKQVARTLPDDAVVGQLLITWLRDGIMPLVRYNTKDLFAAYRDPQSKDPVFRALGRENETGLSPVQTEALDGLLLGETRLGADLVYHYDVLLFPTRAEISVITSRNSLHGAVDAGVLEDLEKVLQRPVSLSVNPPEHPFFDFSPLAKTTRITAGVAPEHVARKEVELVK